MKRILTALALVFSVTMFAQEIEKKPKLEIENDMVKATYFHDNGEIAQTGYYLDGKLHGEWKSFDPEGNSVAIANYENGEKSGDWFFWSEGTLKEVTYQNSKIASVTTWNKKNPVVVNQ